MVKVSGIDLPELSVSAHTLDNGLRVRITPLPHLQEASVSLFVRSGSRYEDRSTNGISHLLEHMFYRGCARYPNAYGVSLAIEELGGDLDAATHVDFASYDLTLPAENLGVGLDRFAAIMLAPQLADADVEKKIIREEILEDLNEDGAQIDIDNIVGEMMFDAHGLGFPITGPLENLEAFGRDALARHFADHYCAANAVLCVAGAVEPNAVVESVHDHFGAWRQGSLAHPAPPPNPRREPFRFVEDPGSQSDLRVAFVTEGTKHADATALSLLSDILDDGLSTRVHRTLCEERGLAYHAFADLEMYEDCGTLAFGAACGHKNLAPLLEGVYEIVEHLRSQPVGEDELHRAKRRQIWSLKAARDDAEAVNHFVGTAALFGLQDDFVRFARALDAITPSDVLRVAQEQLRPANKFTACVGKPSPNVVQDLQRLANAAAITE